MNDSYDAGEELDSLIAEKVMGWHKENRPHDWGGGDTADFWLTADGKTPYPTTRWGQVGYFQPSTDIAAAWQVVEKLRKEWDVGFEEWAEGWCCTLDNGIVWGQGKTFSHAICLAALKAVDDTQKSK